MTETVRETGLTMQRAKPRPEQLARSLSQMCNSGFGVERLKMWSGVTGVLVGTLLLAAPAVAQRVGKPARPSQFQAVVACRQIAENAARLDCFDRQVASLDAAESRSEIVLVDRQQIRSTRRSLFGLALPKIPFLDDGDDEAESAPREYDSKIRSLSAARDGKWTFQLEDAVWRTTEVAGFQPDPKAGDDVKIRRGPLGSFKLSVEGRPAMRAVRVR